MASETQSDFDKSTTDALLPASTNHHDTKLGNTTFSNVAEVRELIRKLQLVEQDMEKEFTTSAPPVEGSMSVNGNETTTSDFDTLSLIDLEGVKLESEDTWLLDTGRNTSSVNKESVFLDSRLLAVRFDLLNTVKQALDEDRLNQRNVQTAQRQVKRNTSYVVRRESEPQERNINFPYYSSPNRDVTASYTYRVPKNRASPARASIFAQQQENETDNNTDLPSPILSSPLNQTIVYQQHSPQTPKDKYATITRSTKLETTFTTTPVDTNKLEGKAGHGNHDMNVTFVRSSEDEAISSPTGSANSPRNNSMEELQSRARQQEQRLRDTPTIRRKDTRVIEYHDINEAKAKITSRTSSTDTYSLGDSNPDSGSSSGVSSPRDSQSYENVQLGPNSIRRSMPNLAHLNQAQRGRGTGLQVMSTSGQIRPQSRFPSDPRLSAQQSASRNMSGQREASNSEINAYGHRSSNLNKNQIPTYTRGDTFYKSRPQVLSIPPSHYQQIPGTQPFVANVQKTDEQRRLLRPSPPSTARLQPQQSYDQADVGYDSRTVTKGLTNGHKLSYARPSILPTPTGGNFGMESSEKPKSRIPAPGNRYKQF